MKIVVLDGYTENPGDLSWAPLEALGDLTVYDRTPPELVAGWKMDRIPSASPELDMLRMSSAVKEPGAPEDPLPIEPPPEEPPDDGLPLESVLPPVYISPSESDGPPLPLQDRTAKPARTMAAPMNRERKVLERGIDGLQMKQSTATVLPKTF